nr:MAG TPA: hypothetical protein [Caudoviricetes sp.]
MAKNTRMCMIIIDNTRDLKSLGVRAVWVQVPLRLPWETKNNQSNKQCRINHRKVVFLFSNFTLPLFPLFASTAYRLHHCVNILLCCPDTATELVCGIRGLYKHVRYW